MMGSEHNRGVIPLAMADVFKTIKNVSILMVQDLRSEWNPFTVNKSLSLYFSLFPHKGLNE